MAAKSSNPKLTLYQKAVREVAEVIKFAIEEDGHTFADAVDQCVEGFRDDVLTYLDEQGIKPEI